ncbi:TPA: hypothetical protein ACH3X1_014026 [Trebouxia sp. C0004]
MTPGTVSIHTTLTSSSGTIYTTLYRFRATSLTAALARDHLSRQRAFNPCRCKHSSSGSRQLVSAVAVVDQEPLQPAKKTRPTAQQIFDLQHVPELSPSLVLYFPVGILFASIRMALWVLLLAADVPWLTDNNTSIAVLQRILGVHVNWHHLDRIPNKRHVLVSNHLTAGDLMMLYSLPRHYIHLISAKLPERISQASHHRVRLWHATKDMYQDLSDSSAHTDPIHLFPEGVMTNGSGMVQFSRGFMRFGRSLPIVPVALRVTVPWNIQTHTLTSSFAANLFWFCFVPWVRLDATVLKPMSLFEVRHAQTTAHAVWFCM